eukprot:6153331-Amphidinium_carterae.1
MSSGVDTRQLGKPDVFNGELQKFNDWKVIAKAYASCINPRMGILMETAAGASREDDIMNINLDAIDKGISTQLYYILLLLTRQQPMTLVVNSGEQEGLIAWRRILFHYEPDQHTRYAGILLNLLSFNFSEGDVEAKMELFEREIIRYEAQSKEQ